jgi:adenylate kinase family enzyme
VLQKQAEKLEELKEEEAKKKPKGRAPKKGEAPPPELKEEEFKYLPKELLKRMLTKRLEEEDCNAGVIYDNLNSEFWADEKAAIDLICETCPN